MGVNKERKKIMSKKYTQLAEQIIEKVGGKENINDVYHCQTRLRFKLKDESKADTKALEAMDGVAKVMINAGVYQVVIGTHVADVFEEIEKKVDLKKGNNSQPVEKKGIVNTIIDFVAGTFQPIIPALSGAGMVKAVLALLVVFKLISNESQTYALLNMFADAIFYFLPVLLAFTEAQKLKCNPILAAGVACILMHPTWNAFVTAQEGVRFFEIIPFPLVSYANSVIPILLIVFVQSYVEKWLNRVVPKAINLVFVPLLVFLIMGTLAFSVLGPLGNIVGSWLAVVFNYLAENAAWAPALLIGGLLPVMVMFGIHNGVAPLGVMQMANLGYDSIFGPGCVCSNMAQASAGLVVALRTKNKKEKQIATSGFITAYMGITEPLLYGVNLPKKYPLVASMIGGACGGLYAGLTHTHRFATGSSGLPAVLLYIGDNTMTFFYNIIIAIVISCVVSAALTYIFSLHAEKGQEAKTIEAIQTHTKPGVAAAPLAGLVKPLSQAKDEAFASEALGKGLVIEPESGDVFSPVDGMVSALFPSKHAIGITAEDGMEILIHIGINTVELNGKHFETFVEQGEHVQAGQPLVHFDREAIEQEGYNTQTMVIVTNSAMYEDIELVGQGRVEAGQDVLKRKG